MPVSRRQVGAEGEDVGRGDSDKWSLEGKDLPAVGDQVHQTAVLPVFSVERHTVGVRRVLCLEPHARAEVAGSTEQTGLLHFVKACAVVLSEFVLALFKEREPLDTLAFEEDLGFVSCGVELQRVGDGMGNLASALWWVDIAYDQGELAHGVSFGTVTERVNAPRGKRWKRSPVAQSNARSV